MSEGETVSLKEHFESRIQAVEKATDLARDNMEKRLAGMNEFRETLRDSAATFATRKEVEAKFDTIEKDKRYGIALVISLLSLLATVLAIIFR